MELYTRNAIRDRYVVCYDVCCVPEHARLGGMCSWACCFRHNSRVS